MPKIVAAALVADATFEREPQPVRVRRLLARRARLPPGADDRGRRLAAPLDGRGRVHQPARSSIRSSPGTVRSSTPANGWKPATSTLLGLRARRRARALFGAFASMEWITLLASLAAAVAAFVIVGKATRSAAPRRAGRRRARRADPRGHRSRSSGTSRRRGSRWASCGCGSRRLVRARRGRARSDELDTAGGRFASASCSGSGRWSGPTSRLMMVCFVVAWFVLVRPRRIVLDLVAMLALPVPLRDLPHGLLRDARAVAPRSPRTRAASMWARAGTTPRTSSGRTDSGSLRSSIVVDDRVPHASEPRSSPPDRHRRHAHGRPAARALHHRDRRRLHARPAPPPRALRAGPARLGRGDRAEHGSRRHQCRRRGVGDRQRRRVPAPTQHRFVSPEPDQRLARRLGSEGEADRRRIRAQRESGGRRVRTRVRAATSS